MKRRTLLTSSLSVLLAPPLWAAGQRDEKLDQAAAILDRATADGQLYAAALYVRHREHEFARSFGAAKSIDDVFLLASISKPMTVAALMTLFDQGRFALDDPVKRFLPEFSGEGRDKITLRQILTHVSGLPDQLPENRALRMRHAPLSEFIHGAMRTPLLFQPGSRYQYSSMGILLACEVAQRLSRVPFHDFIASALFKPLEMKRSALGLGRFGLEDVIRCQLVSAAPESGAGTSAAQDWDWNSLYWRKFGAPWGGAHASAPDVGRFFDEFLHARGRALRPATARLVVRNHNPAGFTPRGLGFGVGTGAGSPGCSERTFGHTGATGTLAWADPATDTICVVLTTLPGRAANPHPRKTAADLVAQAVG